MDTEGGGHVADSGTWMWGPLYHDSISSCKIVRKCQIERTIPPKTVLLAVHSCSVQYLQHLISLSQIKIKKKKLPKCPHVPTLVVESLFFWKQRSLKVT